MCCTFANLRTQANPVRMDQHPRPVLAVPFLFLATLFLLVQEPLAHRVGELEGRDCAAEARRACWWCRTAGGEAAAVTAADAMSTDTPVGLDPVVRFCCRWDRPQPRYPLCCMKQIWDPCVESCTGLGDLCNNIINEEHFSA